MAFELTLTEQDAQTLSTEAIRALARCMLASSRPQKAWELLAVTGNTPLALDAFKEAERFARSFSAPTGPEALALDKSAPEFGALYAQDLARRRAGSAPQGPEFFKEIRKLARQSPSFLRGAQQHISADELSQGVMSGIDFKTNGFDGNFVGKHIGALRGVPGFLERALSDDQQGAQGSFTPEEGGYGPGVVALARVGDAALMARALDAWSALGVTPQQALRAERNRGDRLGESPLRWALMKADEPLCSLILKSDPSQSAVEQARTLLDRHEELISWLHMPPEGEGQRLASRALALAESLDLRKGLASSPRPEPSRASASL